MSDADVTRALGAVSEALAKGAVREAIELSESYADQGLAHPDLSYDRGIAYVMRAKGPDARAGDLGRAAAGFEEALLLRSDDVGAAQALETVRAEAAKRRSHAGGTVDVVEGPGLLRTAVSVMPEPAWEAVAAGASVVFAAAWLLRRRTALARSAYVAVSVSTIALALSAGALAVFRHVRATVEVGVVVAETARLRGDDGPGAVQIPEGARVDVLGRAGGDVQVRWGQRTGILPLSAIRVVGPSRAR